MQETWVQSLGSIPGSGRSLEKEMVTHSSIFVWRIPWTEKPDRLQSMGSQRVRHNWATSLHFTLLLLSHFSRVLLCATPQTAAHQAPPSLGFSRQEHWSGLPFPSPMYESEKSKWSRSVVSDSSDPWTAAYQAAPPMGFSRQKHWSGVPFIKY